MNYIEYQKIIRDIPTTDGIEYNYAVAGLHLARLPLCVKSLGNGKSQIIKLPTHKTNKYGFKVPVVRFSAEICRGNKLITDVILHSKIWGIPKGAFAGCSNLKRITIPRKVDKIEEGTFAECDSLEDIYYEGTREEWERIQIELYKYETVLGELIPGTPVEAILEHRRVYLPGNEALLKATIHFNCEQIDVP